MEENKLIQISGLSISFKDHNVVSDLSLDIRKAETLAIVGESGSGKSLTALSLLKLLPKTARLAGEILLQKTPVIANKPVQFINISQLAQENLQKIRGHSIAMIFQEPMTSLNPVKNCGIQVAEAIMTHKKLNKKTARKQVTQLFREVQLTEPEAIYDRFPHEISGGQKQRVMIAMAMSCQPQLLICDEPTTALDVMVQKEILQLIKSLQQKTGMSVLFISHDIKLVEEIADRIAVFYQGALIELGDTASLMHNPVQPYTKALLACRPGLYQRGERLPVVSDFMRPEHHPSDQQKRVVVQPVAKPANPVLQTTAPILTLKDLQVWYPAAYSFWGQPIRYNKAVDKVSFEVYPGETLGLVGGSGCGKTTLGRAIIGLTAVHGGEIRFKNTLLTPARNKTAAANAREIQMIFQDPYGALNPKITIGEAIFEALYVHKLLPKNQIKAEVLRWLDRVGLKSDQYDRYPHEFSGGQRQRIVIARALALKPSFVICDESVSALDVSVQAQVLNLFNDLKAELNFTTIFISHDLSVVKYLCDRIAVMNKGKLEEIGVSDEVYYHPSSAYTKSLLRAIPGVLPS